MSAAEALPAVPLPRRAVPRPELARFLRDRFGPVMYLANIIGAIDVYVLFTWVLPTPDRPSGVTTRDTIAFLAFLAFTGPLGGWISYRQTARIAAWLRRGGPPSAVERDDALRLPLRETYANASLWLLGAAFFTLVELQHSGDLARYAAITVVMGGLTTCALTYLLAERLLRPITALALAGQAPRDPVTPGVAGRLLLSWLLATGVPLLGLLAVGIDVLGNRDISKERIAATMIALSVAAAASGLAATIFVAKSVAGPVRRVRNALARVEDGDLDVEVRVDDGSEVGLLQSGFNEMAA